MSLFIKYANGAVGQTHIGVKISSGPKISADLTMHSGDAQEYDVENVTEVQADGDELVRIQSWKNLPNNSRPVQRFFGDHAKYIIANWY